MNAQDQTRLRFAAVDTDVMLGHDTAGAARAYAGGWGDSCSCTAERPCDDHADELLLEGLLVDQRPARWVVALAAAAFGVAVGLLLAVALIPDQPERIIVPVEQPTGVQAPPPEEWSA